MSNLIQETKSFTVNVTPDTFHKQYIKWVSPILGINQLEADTLERICLNKSDEIDKEALLILQANNLLTSNNKPCEAIQWDKINVSKLKVTFTVE